MPPPLSDELPEVRPAFRVALRFWLKLGLISFGGPAGQIAIMQTELVEKRRWISQPCFLHALNFCMLLPGPEAQQLAIYSGWLLHRTRGGIAAGALFVLPSVFILWALSFVYAAYGQVPWIAAIFGGLQPVVMAIVAAAVIRIARKSLTDWLLRSVALVAFIGIFIGKIPFPIIILGAGLVGFVATWLSGTPRDQPLLAPGQHEPHIVSESAWRRAIRITAVSLTLWWTPILLAGASFGWNSTLFRQALFFSKAAVVTFGGAYAVLPYVAQQAVEHYGWLHAGQMMDGLGLAETTPGPLIMVLQFVGFMGGWNQPGALSPLLSATLSALLTTWVTFVPCFLWVFLGAPYLERLHQVGRLKAALRTVTAAVVGVILNLAVWFGLHAIFPLGGGTNWFAIALGLVTFIGLVRWKWNIIAVVLGGGVCGWLFYLARS